MKKTLFFSKRLDDSTESVKDNSNHEMKAADQSPENSQAKKKTPLTLKLIGLIAVIGIAVGSLWQGLHRQRRHERKNLT